MLRAFIQICKNLNGTEVDRVALKPLSVDSVMAACPKCKARNLTVKHATYTRHFVYLDGNEVSDKLITVQRLRCTSCNSTHAVLPLAVVPYSVYSIRMVAHIVLDKISGRFKNIESLCQHYRIAVNTCYSLLKRFEAAVRIARGITAGRNDVIKTAILLAFSYLPEVNSFLQSYFEVSGRSFCQSHDP